MTTDQDTPDAPTPEETADMQRAAQGYVTEVERWLAMLIEFADSKLRGDPDWAVFQRVIEMIPLTGGKDIKNPGKVFDILAFQKNARRNPARPDAFRYLANGKPVVLHAACAEQRGLTDRREILFKQAGDRVYRIGPAFQGERCADCEAPREMPRMFNEEQVRQLLWIIGLHTNLTALAQASQALNGEIDGGEYGPQLDELMKIARGTWVNAGPYGVGSEDDANLDIAVRAIW
jgi:hypothetical protein